MTGLLEQALKRVEALSSREQDQIAAQILASIDDDESWDLYVHDNLPQIREMAKKALEERRSGHTRPLEELIGE